MLAPVTQAHPVALQNHPEALSSGLMASVRKHPVKVNPDHGQCLGQLDPWQSHLVIQKPGVAESPTCHPSSVLGPPALSHQPRHGGSAPEHPLLQAWNSRKMYRPANKSSFLGAH